MLKTITNQSVLFLLFSGRYEQTSSTKSYMYYVEMYEGKKIPVTEWTPVQGEFQLSLFWVQGVVYYMMVNFSD